MRSVFLILLGIGIGGCGSLPSNTADLGIKSRLGTVRIEEGIFHCAGPDAKNPNKYPDCKGIPVIVLHKKSGECLALIPYRDLHVHTGGYRTEVVWRLHGPANYRFHAGDGVKLVKQPNSSDPTQPNAVYDRKQHQGQSFKHEVMPGALGKKFDHDASVLDGNGKLCEPIDPVIINSDN